MYAYCIYIGQKCDCTSDKHNVSTHMSMMNKFI